MSKRNRFGIARRLAAILMTGEAVRVMLDACGEHLDHLLTPEAKAALAAADQALESDGDTVSEKTAWLTVAALRTVHETLQEGGADRGKIRSRTYLASLPDVGAGLLTLTAGVLAAGRLAGLAGGDVIDAIRTAGVEAERRAAATV